MIVLASASPRRRDLLSQLVSEFEVVVSEVDEDMLTTSDPRQTAESLAVAKAQAVQALRPESVVIGADTVVALGDVQLAKPVDAGDAIRMLTMLSGRTHVVLTGCCVASPVRVESFVEETMVSFRPLSNEEIEEYVATGEPMDKAGAYAIQGGAFSFVEATQGSKSNVIGLPLERLEKVLRLFDAR